MKLRAAALVVLALAAACGGEPPAPPAEAPPQPSADEQALTALREAWQQGYNSQQAAAVAELYADSAWVLETDGSYLEGRPAVQTSLEASLTAPATVSIAPGEAMFLGDMAVTLGGYTVQSTGPDGAPMSWGGTYLNALTRAGGGWKILGSLTNYDTARPEGWTYDTAPLAEPVPEEGTMKDLAALYQARFDAGQADSVAALYAEDAVASFADGPILRGRAAIAEALRARLAAAPSRIVIHDVGTLPMGAEWALDGGWYELFPQAGGEAVRVGSYLSLARRGADGSWKLHWHVSNGYPPKDE